MHATAAPTLALPSRKVMLGLGFFLAFLAGMVAVAPSYALDLVAFTGITGPLVSALTQLAALGPGVKALVAFVGFVVAFISLAALRNFGPVLFYLGMAIFGAVGLTIAGAILGAVMGGYQIVAGYFIHLYRGRYKFGSFDEVRGVVASVALVGFSTEAALLLVGDGSIPRSTPIIATGLALIAMLFLTSASGLACMIFSITSQRARASSPSSHASSSLPRICTLFG